MWNFHIFLIFLHMKPIFRMALDLRCSVHGICCGFRLFLPYASDMYGIYKKGDESKKTPDGWSDGMFPCGVDCRESNLYCGDPWSVLYELPFHLCSMAGILCAVHCLTKWKWLGQVLYTICLPGTVLALLFPNWNFYPVIHFITLEGFLFHMGIVLYVAGNLHPMKSDRILQNSGRWCYFWLRLWYRFTGLIKDMMWIICLLNWPSAGSPLVWLADRMGNPGYLTGYAALVFLCMLLMDVGYLMVAGRRKQKLFFLT